jgi:glyoxylase-like metal-dependent hydrolase (beta-lactamase superfamily II)
MSRLIFLFSLGLLCACAPRGDDVEPATAEPAVADNEQVQNRGADKDNWWDTLPRPEWSAFEKIEQSEDWFEVYRIDDDIFAIYEPGQFEEVISFLIVGEDFALMFDTGLGIGNIRRVVDQLTDKDIVVLNSHTHYDHIGGNHLFDTVYGTRLDYTAQRSMGSPPEAVAGFLRDGWVWKTLPADFDATMYRSQPFDIDQYVEEGDQIDIGGRVLEILFTPGHAPDSICLLDRENRLLFTGDTFYLAPLYTHLPGSSFDDYARTAGRLAELADDIDAAITSHNVPKVDSAYMSALGQAFADIEAGRASDVTISDGNREYHFDGFSIIVKDDER